MRYFLQQTFEYRSDERVMLWGGVFLFGAGMCSQKRLEF